MPILTKLLNITKKYFFHQDFFLFFLWTNRAYYYLIIDEKYNNIDSCLEREIQGKEYKKKEHIEI